MGILTQNRGSPNAAGRIAARARDLWLTQDCLLCGQDNTGDILCDACRETLPRLPAARCPCCALPAPDGERCGRCLTHSPHYDRTLAVFAYGFPVDKLVQDFKYVHRLALARFFGRLLAELAENTVADLIIPLPLHRERLRDRGFNQALELARPVATARRLPLAAEACLRTRNTPAQAGLPWKERAKNIRGAFHCTHDLSGQRILLVDDVMTTGSSLDECARTLKLHGATEVTLLIVARALP